MSMAPFVFFILFLVQTASGYPFSLLILFAHGVFSPLFESIFWALLAGVSFGILFGNGWYWLFIALATNLFLQFLNRYVIRKKTPALLSLLFLLVIIFWHLPGLTGEIEGILLLFFPLSFLFFLCYAIWVSQTTRHQKRLF